MIAAATGVAAAAISVSPVRIRLAPSAGRTITVANGGGAAAVVDARLAGFVLDRRGRPVLARGQAAAGWLRLEPKRLVVGPGRAAALTVSSSAPAGASPGDHPALVLLTTQPRPPAGIAVRVRIGVVVVVRIPGRIVHRLELGPLGVRNGVLEAVIANRGNVVEQARVRITLRRRGRILERLGPVRRTLLPHSRGIQRFRCRARLRGWMTAQVEAGAQRRAFRIKV